MDGRCESADAFFRFWPVCVTPATATSRGGECSKTLNGIGLLHLFSRYRLETRIARAHMCAHANTIHFARQEVKDYALLSLMSRHSRVASDPPARSRPLHLHLPARASSSQNGAVGSACGGSDTARVVDEGGPAAIALHCPLFAGLAAHSNFRRRRSSSAAST